MPNVELDQAKQEIREWMWTLLEREHAAPHGVHGHIPAFVGAEAAADRLARLPVWQAAEVIKAVPDKAQLPVRVRALREGKLVYMAVPRLAEERPFFLLDPARLPVPAAEAASHQAASKIARKVAVEELQPVDLIVCGSVAVNPSGVRLGKGGGYSDLEVALLAEAGLIGPDTTIITTVHALQVVETPLPETEHDFRVDVIVTPEEVIACGAPRRPDGVHWEHVTPQMLTAIPLLAARARSMGSAASRRW